MDIKKELEEVREHFKGTRYDVNQMGVVPESWRPALIKGVDKYESIITHMADVLARAGEGISKDDCLDESGVCGRCKGGCGEAHQNLMKSLHRITDEITEIVKAVKR